MNRILNSLIRVSYGILFPLLLLFFTLTSHFQIQKQNKVEAYKSQMSDKLNLLFDYHSDSVFFHSILQKNFRIADKSINPDIALDNMIAKFRSRFANNIKFIVWDKNGNINKNLSDKTSYRYVLNIVFKVVNNLSALCTKSFPPNVNKLVFVKKNMGLIRKILGRLLVIGEIHKPFGNGYMGKCTVASTKEENGLVWYQKGINFTITCFINKTLLMKNLPVQILTKRFNLKSHAVKLAAYDFFTRKMYGTDSLSEIEKNRINLEVAKYKLATPPFNETEDLLFLSRQPSENLLIFSYVKKTDNFNMINDVRNRILCKVISIFFIIYFVLYAYFLVHEMTSFSVKQRLVLLFLFVSLVGLLTIIATGYKFFSYKKNVLINDIQNKSLQDLKDIGKKYESIRNQIGEKLNKFIDDQNDLAKGGQWPKAMIEKTKKFIGNMGPTEAYIYNRDTKKIDVLHQNTHIKITKSSIQFISFVLKFANQKKIEKTMKKIGTTLIDLEADRILYYILNILNRVKLSRLLTNNRWCFYKLLGDPTNVNSWGIISVTWSLDEMQSLFFNNNIMQLNKEFSPRKLIVMTKDNEIIFPGKMGENAKIRNILHRAFTRSSVVDNNFILRNKSYIAMAISEDTSLKCSLMSLYPREIIEKQILNLKYITLFLIVISSFLLLIISWVLSNMLIAPVSDLASGVSRIKANNFNSKIENITSDELGDLETLVNETMESMEMLSVGTSIQKSLLPSRNYEKGSLELYADSVFMTKMGGDYFDYFEKDKKKLTLMFGDVSGHGIPAGMIMGMVKAIVTEASMQSLSPLTLLSKINKVLRGLKKKGWRGAMSCQCIDIDSISGKITIANAGHCFPVIVNSDGSESRYLKALGMPLGSRFEKRTKEENFTLRNGETLILYSDGIVEGVNSFGEPLGYEKFQDLIIGSWSTDPKVYWNNIYSSYKDWAQEQDDDITFMVIRMHKS